MVKWVHNSSLAAAGNPCNCHGSAWFSCNRQTRRELNSGLSAATAGDLDLHGRSRDGERCWVLYQYMVVLNELGHRGSGTEGRNHTREYS